MFLAGLDLGQSQDYSAFIVLQRLVDDPIPWWDTRPQPQPRAHYAVRHLERWPLGTSYSTIVADVQERLRRSPLAGEARLVVDRTGVGQPLIDYLRRAGLDPIPVFSHGGDQVHWDRKSGWRTPKRDLVGCIKVLLQEHRLAFAEGHPLTAALTRELLTFRAEIDTVTAHDSYGAWYTKYHKDLVFATALCCWFAEESGKFVARTW